MKSRDLSIVVPLFNEEECVELLYQEIIDSLNSLDVNFEILFVDDGSSDKTFALARALADKDNRLRVIKLRSNYGQTAAFVAGIEYARGKLIITMDGDLQNDPADIPKFLGKIDEGYDIVCGWRHRRQDKLFSRKIPSKVANWMIGKITGVPIKDNGCSLKAFRSEVIKSVSLYSDMHRFIPAITSLAGTTIAEIKVNHRPRRFGVTKYGISRIYKVIIDLIIVKILISFSDRPVYFFTLAGMAALFLGTISFFTSIFGFIIGKAPIDFMFASASMLFFTLFFFLILIGLLSELALKTGSYKGFSQIKRIVE